MLFLFITHGREIGGASVSLLLLNSEQRPLNRRQNLCFAREIWIAHVGDCRCVMGVPDGKGNSREFHMSPQALTEERNGNAHFHAHFIRTTRLRS